MGSLGVVDLHVEICSGSGAIVLSPTSLFAHIMLDCDSTSLEMSNASSSKFNPGFILMAGRFTVSSCQSPTSFSSRTEKLVSVGIVVSSIFNPYSLTNHPPELILVEDTTINNPCSQRLRQRSNMKALTRWQEEVAGDKITCHRATDQTQTYQSKYTIMAYLRGIDGTRAAK